jgi:hypothetical protein
MRRTTRRTGVPTVHGVPFSQLAMAAELSRKDVQTALAKVLLERVRQDNYPSQTQMDLLEEVIPPELVRDYVNVLLEKTLMSRWPSISLLRRLQRVTARLP